MYVKGSVIDLYIDPEIKFIKKSRRERKIEGNMDLKRKRNKKKTELWIKKNVLNLFNIHFAVHSYPLSSFF